MAYFNRVEVMALTGMTLSQLMTLEKNRLVVPNRDSGVNIHGATILYSWPQVIQLKAIARLRQWCATSAIDIAIKDIDELVNQPDLSDRRLIVYGNWLDHIVDTPSNFYETILNAVDANPGLPFDTFSIKELIDEIESKSDQVIDFASRFSQPKP